MNLKTITLKNFTLFLSVLFVIPLWAQNPPSYDIDTRVVNDTIGILYDDGGPTLNYADNRNYVFTITSSNGKPVNIRFEQFALELNDINQPGLCIYDYIRIYDGVDTSATATRYCGTSIPPDFTSTGASVTIHFLSDGATNAAGFKMLWSTGELPEVEKSYCEASGPICGEGFVEITSFSFNDFTNTSSVCFGFDPKYQDFTDSIIPYEVGTVVNIFGILDGALGTETVDIYIDWNHDGDFEDSDELIKTVNTGISTEEFVGAIVPPQNPTLGLTRLRLRAYDPVFGLGTSGPCGATDDGEVEDYTLFIFDPANPIPSCSNLLSPADNATNQCSDITFVWNASADATSYKLRVTTASGAEVENVSGLTDTTFTITGLSANTEYFWTVSPRNDNGEAFGCQQFSFETGVAHPTVSFNPSSVSICENSEYIFSATVSGGDGAYSYNWYGPAASILDDTSASLPELVDKTVRPATDLYLEVEDARGCLSKADTLSVTIKEVVSAPEIILSNAVSCFDTVFFYEYPSGPYLYQLSTDSVNWNTYTPSRVGGDSIQVSTNGADSLYLRNISIVNGCADTSATVLQTILPEPEVPEIEIVSGDLSNCKGDVVELAAANYDTGITWSMGATTDTISIIVAGKVSYRVLTNNACEAFSDTLDIEFLGPDNAISLNASDSIFLCEGEEFTFIANNNEVVWNDAAATQNDSLTVSQEGLYFASFTIGNCRFNSDSIYLSVNPVPSQPSLVFEEPDRLCDGLDSALIVAPSGFEWISPMSNTDSIYVFESGLYFGQITNEFGCVSLSDTVEVAFNPTPAKPIISALNDTVLVGNADQGQTFFWLRNGQIVLSGIDEDTLVLGESGAYNLLVLSGEGCPSELSETFNYTKTGIKDFENGSQLSLYPNPNQGGFTLSGMPNSENTIRVINSAGEEVFKTQVTGATWEAELGLPAGIYVIQVLSDNTSAVKRVIIE